MKHKKIRHKAKKFIKKMNKKYLTLEDQSTLIDEYYPGPQYLTTEEVLAKADFDSNHEYQFYIAKLRKIREGTKAKCTFLSGEEIDELFESKGTATPL